MQAHLSFQNLTSSNRHTCMSSASSRTKVCTLTGLYDIVQQTVLKSVALCFVSHTSVYIDRLLLSSVWWAKDLVREFILFIFFLTAQQFEPR